MATGTNGIATEGEAKEKLGYSGSVDTNKCCTKARAVAMGADSSKLTSYKDNQLVKYSDLYQAGLDPDTAPYGVYICDNKGRLWKREDWDTASNSKASGVAVIFTTYYKFVIAKEEQKGIEWGGYGTLINFCTTTTDLNRAKTDYNGKDNTDSIIAQLGESETYAARYCKEYVFPHGVKGYLPALGELYKAYQNKSEVDACMSLIGGKPLYDSSISNYRKWSSTQCNNNTAWSLNWYDGNITNLINKNQKYYDVRPFAPFK